MVKDTARKYLDVAALKVDLEATEKRIRDRPLFYVALAAGAGFAHMHIPIAQLR